MKLEYHKNLDGVRGIAVLMVMIFHFFPVINEGTIFPFLKKISNLGQTGVTLFFVLSGFLITRILINTKNKKKYFSNFYMRRFLRIFPLYYFFLLLTYFVFPFIFNQEVPTWGQQAYFYAYLQNFAMTFGWNSVGPGHFWSLAVEEHFYMFWPLVVYFFNIKQLKRLIFGIIGFAFVLRIILILNNYNVFYFTFTRFDALAIGALLAIYELKGKLQQNNSKKFLFIFILSIVPAVFLWVFFAGKGNNIIQAVKFLFIAFTYFGIIGYLISINSDKRINKALRIKFLIYSGKISYGLYVFHPISSVLFVDLLPTKNMFLELFGSFIMSYILSSLSYYLIELNFLKLKRFFN